MNSKKYFLLFIFSLWGTLAGFSQTITNVGTDFWIAFPPNSGPNLQIKLFISSNYSTSGFVSSVFPGVNQSFTVTPGIVTQLTIPSGVQLVDGTEDKGIHVTSNDPISLYGVNTAVASADAYLALPVNALGLDYRIVTYATTFNTSAPSSFSVVSIQEGTELSVFNHQTNSTSIVQLHVGQTYHVRGINMDDDMTGSRVQSNVPVAVFGSAPLVYLPAGCAAGDHIIEQMFPYYSWGKNFVTVSLAGRDASGDVFRIVAAEDATNISINGTATATINAGDYFETDLTGNNVITTSKATMLAQFAKGEYCTGMITGDPMMMLIPPREQFLTNYTISTVDGFSSWVNIVAPDYAIGSIYQDGVLIPTSAFSPVPSTTWFGAQRPVTPGSHTFTSLSPFGVFVYGWQATNAYGYPGGCSLSQIGTVSTVTISPPTTSGVLNVSTLCFTAHVQDNLSNPVAGVLVNFNISGISNITGTAYTDALGNAQYCYSRTGTITGTDNIFAECFGITSTTSTAIWTLTPLCINPTNSGSIGSSQSGCGSFTPTPLISITLPSGYSGTLEYKWQQSTTSSVAGFSDITGSNFPDYTPGTLTQTTWYRRIARVNCMSDWIGAAVTEALEMTVNTPATPSVVITADLPQVCAGSTVTFTATVVNGGTSPGYQWKVNGTNAGTSTPVYSYVPLNGDQITCLVASSMTCTTSNPVTSNTITMIVNPILPVSVIITSSANPVCSGTPVTFTAAPVNGGSTPGYQWKVNSINVINANNAIFTYTPVNGDIVQCVLTSSNTVCTFNNPASSNVITMMVNPVLPVSVTISLNANPICTGNPVTFTATPVNGGTSPGYQWKINAINVINATNAVFSYAPVNGDVVTCSLLSSETCTSGNPALSNPITMVVNANLPAGITIAASANPFCPGSAVNFTATPVNGGSNPSYQWKVNGINAGTNSSSFSYVPANNDSVRCVINSNLSCVSGNPASSAKIIMIGTLAPSVAFSACFDTITTVNAKPFQLKGGLPIGGTYSGPGVNSSTGIFTPSVAGIGVKTINYSYINVHDCGASKSKSIVVQLSPSFTCGGNFTDTRDNKVYPTVQIGTQCWMQTNLGYGTEISSNIPQTDNCIPEKYSRHVSSVTRHDFYQWDELMQYQTAEGSQGLCPPGWHVPTESEWTTLMNYYLGNGRAGRPLQDTVINGFKALRSGVFYLNSSWSFLDFATMFWSSTLSGYTHPDGVPPPRQGLPTPTGSNRALAHGMNLHNFSVSLYPASRGNAFGVRCLKDSQ